MQDKITIANAPECLNTNDQAMWVLGYQAAIEARSPCLLQIQEPTTKTEALAHYSQQAILAMDEAAPAAAPVVLPEPDFHVRPASAAHPHRALMIWDNDATSEPAYFARTVRALLAGVSAPAAQAVPEFCHVAQRKLKNLLERGYTVTGYAIENPVDGAQPDRGFINHGGFVGWWWDGQTPQVQADARDAELLDFIESHADGVIRLDAVPNYLYWGKHWEHKTARAAIAAAKGE